MEFTLRTATLSDRPELEALIARSIRQLGAADYSTEQIEAALKGAFGVDTQLIADGTYFVAEAQGRVVGCGGWSHRRTLFGGDAHARRDAGELDPAQDAARIRAFFVDPQAARLRGSGREPGISPPRTDGHLARRAPVRRLRLPGAGRGPASARRADRDPFRAHEQGAVAAPALVRWQPRFAFQSKTPTVQACNMKSFRPAAVFIVTCLIVGFALGLLSGYLQAHGEHAIPLMQRLTMSLGAAAVLAAMTTFLTGNRAQARAPAAQDSDAKRFAPVAERTVVYLFRDAFVGKLLGIDVAIDGVPLGQTRGKTFYRLELAPGEHVLSSTNPQDSSREEYRFTASA
jgi:hypothetical protein